MLVSSNPQFFQIFHLSAVLNKLTPNVVSTINSPPVKSSL